MSLPRARVTERVVGRLRRRCAAESRARFGPFGMCSGQSRVAISPTNRPVPARGTPRGAQRIAPSRHGHLRIVSDEIDSQTPSATAWRASATTARRKSRNSVRGGTFAEIVRFGASGVFAGLSAVVTGRQWLHIPRDRPRSSPKPALFGSPSSMGMAFAVASARFLALPCLTIRHPAANMAQVLAANSGRL
jgi:hypothetical protein